MIFPVADRRPQVRYESALARTLVLALTLAFTVPLPLAGCGKDDPKVPEAAEAPPESKDAPSASERPATDGSTKAARSMPLSEPVDLAAGCRPWLATGSGAGLEDTYATLFAEKHPAKASRFVAAVKAWRSVERENPAVAIPAQLELVLAASDLHDPSIVDALVDLSGKGFDLYASTTLADAEREASLPAGSIARAIGIPQGFDPEAIRYGMLAFSAQAVAASLEDRGFSPTVIAALLREDIPEVKRLARESVAELLVNDLERRALEVPEGLREGVVAAPDRAGIARLIPQEIAATLYASDADLDRWILATAGFPAECLAQDALKTMADAVWDGELLWLAYSQALTWSLPLGTPDIEALRSERWGSISREAMNAAIFAFLRLPGGIGAEWLGNVDRASLARFCQRPLWDADSKRMRSMPDPGATLADFERWRRYVESEIATFSNLPGGAP